MSRRRLVAAAGALAVAAAAGVAMLRGGAADGIPAEGVPLFRVERGTVRRTVVGEGFLKAVDATPISVPPDARQMLRVAWVVPEGSRVAAGDVVVRFDPTEMERDLLDGENDREIADQEISRTQRENDTQLANLRTDAELAERERQQAERFAARDAEIFSRQQILDAEIDRELAAHKADSARRRSDGVRRQGQTQMDLLGIQRGKAELKIRQARQGLDALVVRAPHAGFLTLDRNWRGEAVRTGDQVWPGQKIGEIPDASRVEAIVFLLEADAGGLAPGLAASLVVEAHPGKSYAAKVSRVDALAKPRYWNVPVQYFEAALLPEGGEPEAMKPGQRVRAEIVLEEVGGALVVPPQAVTSLEGKDVCYRREGSRMTPVPVRVGARGWGRVAILEGLQEGEEVALKDPRPGVRPREEKIAPAAPAAPGGGVVVTFR